jgi:hypothetical protein
VCARRSSRVQASLARGNCTPVALQHPAAPPAAPCCPASRAPRTRVIRKARRHAKTGGGAARAHQLVCSLTPCHSSSSARRVQLDHPRVPRNGIVPRIAGAPKNGGEKRRCAPIRLQQQQRRLCWCARKFSRPAHYVVPGLTQHQQRWRAFGGARWRRRCVCAACAAHQPPQAATAEHA